MCQVYAESREGPKSDQIMMWLFTTLVQSKCGWTPLRACHFYAAQGSVSKVAFLKKSRVVTGLFVYTSAIGQRLRRGGALAGTLTD